MRERERERERREVEGGEAVVSSSIEEPRKKVEEKKENLAGDQLALARRWGGLGVGESYLLKEQCTQVTGKFSKITKLYHNAL